MDEISGLDEGKRNYFVNLFVENYRNEHNSREKILFNKKLKHKFLIISNLYHISLYNSIILK